MNDAMLIASLWLSAKAQRGRAAKSVVKNLQFSCAADTKEE
jgi:hypothetical protein